LTRCCVGDEGRPFGVALREEASNRPPGPWLKTVRGARRLIRRMVIS
jgi:hypothetical protein